MTHPAMSESPQPHVIIIGASSLVLPAYHIAREELGLRTIAVDWNADAPGMRVADQALAVSTKDADGVVAAVKALPAHVKPVGVYTCGADVEITVARVAEALGLPGNRPDVAEICNDKIRMHEHLDACGFTAKPRYRVVTSADDAGAAARAIGLPVVIKPVNNCGSRGVQRIDAIEDVATAFTYAAGFNLGDEARVLIEQCVLGTKHTVEMIVEDGRWHLASVADTHYLSPRWPCESRLTVCLLPPAEQERLFQFATEVARQVGIEVGGHKVDVNLAADGTLTLIELTARMSGGFHCQFASPLAYGTREIRAALRLVTGGDFVADDLRHQWERAAVVEAVFPEPGLVRAIRGLEEVRNSPGVREVILHTEVGAEIKPYRNSTDRVAFLIVDGATVDEAIGRATAAAAKLHIETTPPPASV